MKKLPTHLLVSIFTFFLGLILVFALNFELISKDQIAQLKNELDFKSIAVKSPKLINDFDENENKFGEKQRISLDDYWIKNERFSYKDYTITKKCYEKNNFDYERCKLRLIRKGKIVQEFVSYDETRLEYGFFNFLGKKDKQLVMFRNEGGSCSVYNYLIYDLKPKLRLIYDSRKFQKDIWHINFELIPIDINEDGIFEFTQAVHTFDFFHASHANSVYPTAVFSYDKKAKKYRFANRQFSNFIVNELNTDFEWLKKNHSEESSFVKRYVIKNIFLNLIYVGKKQKGWKFFEENYDFEDKQKFKEDVKKELANDPIYKLIYY